MAELLKNIYHQDFIKTYSSVLNECLNMSSSDIEKLASTDDWYNAALKERMNMLAAVTEKLLPDTWIDKFSALRSVVDKLRQWGVKDQNLEYIFLADIVCREVTEVRLEKVFEEMEVMTQFVSFEFAVRPLIVEFQDRILSQMFIWASHKNENVRRLATEGCRPRLPWGIRLHTLMHHPEPVLPILEKLKNDASLYVRKSVANHLNDISWSHPELVLQICDTWSGMSKNTDWIVRNGLRTLLKKGHKRALDIIGVDVGAHFDVSGFQLATHTVRMQESLVFAFELKNLNRSDTLYRVEYIIYFIRKNGQYNKKVFKISELTLSPLETIQLSKKHAFASLTTRQHYVGQHYVSLVINGQEGQKWSFNIVK